jgi:cation diffusion facilitator CzcD-associated flavoprotein CzcO
VVVCTGYNRVPNHPDLPGLGTFGGGVLHSHTYRNGAPLRGQRVLVVGMGNTGAQVALAARAGDSHLPG